MIRVSVITSQSLSTAQKTRLRGLLEKKHGKVEMVETVDSSVVGGIRITVGSQEYDATVKGKLLKLRDQLLQNG